MSAVTAAPGEAAPPPDLVIHVASGREWRGGQHQVLLLASGQHRCGVRVTVITGASTELEAQLREAGVPVLAAPWALGLDPRAALVLRSAMQPGAIIHAHDSHAHALADFATRRQDRTILVTRRTAFPIRHPRRYRRADAVIAISNAVRRELIAAGCEPQRIHVVPDAVESTTDGAPLEQSASRSLLIVCIAALAPEKGLDTLLDAAVLLRATHPSVRWLVVGEGPQRRALERRRADLLLDSVVEFAGRRPAAGELRRATIAVQPSRSEGLGSAVLQALALGVPVIASDTGGLPDALAHGGGVLVPPDQPAELAGAVARLIDDTAGRTRLADAGRVAATYFSVDRLVERTLDVYRVTARTRPSR